MVTAARFFDCVNAFEKMQRYRYV